MCNLEALSLLRNGFVAGGAAPLPLASLRMRVAALIMAAGRGSRLGADQPKQYLPLGGKPLFRHSLERFRSHPRVSLVRCIIGQNDVVPDFDGLAVVGGETRQDSVLRGLESLVDEAVDLVLIHDAARPFVDATIIDRVLAALEAAPGAVPALPVVDSLRQAIGERVTGSVPRDGLWRAQTPQGFRYAEILAAHRAAAGLGLSDDAAVAGRAGLEVRLVAGSEDNFKITTAEDLARAERLLAGAADEVRVGSGFDVHRFGPGAAVTLCGVVVPHSAGLVGHSDADVGLHALTDAVLGALGAGDIGQHFPPSDPRWRGQASELFLRHAAGLVTARGGRIAHVDVTLLCEAPKVAPHREAMRARIAEIIGVALDRVSVKATTTERLGFLGRGEGIAAQATATVRLPAG
jgi:2-C-methyl-D-erythritol 4-phosphate cytidylyltransferase/2-C-methyl-D-erythritol 2,4-cyclodiphosphate synthase